MGGHNRTEGSFLRETKGDRPDGGCISSRRFLGVHPLFCQIFNGGGWVWKDWTLGGEEESGVVQGRKRQSGVISRPGEEEFNRRRFHIRIHPVEDNHGFPEPSSVEGVLQAGGIILEVEIAGVVVVTLKKDILIEENFELYSFARGVSK